MSSVKIRAGQGANQLTGDYSREKLLLFGAVDSQRPEILKNTGATDLVLREGRILARISAATDQGKLVVLAPTATNGTQNPVGVYFGPERTIKPAAEATVSIVVGGDINENVVVNADVGNPNLDTTIIDNRSLRDQLQAQTVGLKLVASTPISNFDN